jgi:hypothetical protein
MAKDPAVLLYYKDILVSCAGWDEDELGWYFRLLCHQADKPNGLENDIESLASLAGVKFSKYDRFKKCWERTLKAKFKIMPDGFLLNEKLKGIIDARSDYSEKQTTRGIIGYFIKITKNNSEITEEQSKELYKKLEIDNLLDKSREERFICYKRTLIALLGNAIGNAIVNTIETKEGLGGNSKQKNKTNGKFSGNFKAQGEELFAERVRRGKAEIDTDRKENS